MIDLCAVGDLKWLLILSVPRFPPSGEMTPVTGMTRQMGNDAAIVSLQAARLGMRSRLVPTNALARPDGQPLIDLLQRDGVDISTLNTEGMTTPITFCLSQAITDERTWLVEDCAFQYNSMLDQPPDFPFAYLDLYEEYLAERLALLRRWSEAHVRCLVNLSASRLEEKVRQLAQLPFLDTIQMRGSGSLDDARSLGRAALQSCKARAVVVTLGADGVILLDQRHEYFIAAERIQPVRTIGAGASFAAGFLSALREGAIYQDAAAFASRHAARFCTASENPVEVMRR